jgi:hypothetical protein
LSKRAASGRKQTVISLGFWRYERPLLVKVGIQLVAADTWATAYEEKFGEVPAPQTVVGYVIGDLVVRALEEAGPDLKVEDVLAAPERIDKYEDPFGGPSLSFSPTKHAGGDYLNMYHMVDGKWEVVERNLPY